MRAYRQILELIRVHQRRSCFLHFNQDLELTLIDLYVLGEIAVDPHVTVRGLQDLLMLDHGTVSRSYYKLIKEGYIESNLNPDNRRKRIVTVSARGQEYLKQHDQLSSEFLTEHLSRVSIQEMAEIQRCYMRIADVIGVHNIVLRPGEHPFINGTRRLTRGLGLVGPSIFGSGHSNLIWQLLAIIRDLAPYATLTTLTNLFSIKPSTLCQQIDRLEEDGLVARQSIESDARTKKIVLTDKGFNLLESIYHRGEAILAKAFDKERPGVVEQFIIALMKHFGVIGEENLSTTTQPVTTTIVKTDEQRKIARAYLIMHLTKTGRFLDLPETLISSSNQSVIFYQGSRVRGVIELSKSGQGWLIVNYGLDKDIEEGSDLLSLFQAVIVNLASHCDNPKIIVSNDRIPESLVEKMQKNIRLQHFIEIHYS